MSILRASFFLFVCFFTVFVKAQQPASDVFVDFVIEQLESSGQVAEFEEVMSSDWIDEITLYTTSWDNNDAERFLNVLKGSGVESEDILKILQAGSYLQALHVGRLDFQFNGEVESLSSASDIFFDFVTEQLEPSGQIEEFEEIMGPRWIDEITLYTASWNGADAEHFLSILNRSNVGSKHILKLLQTGSFLQALQAGRLHFEFQVATQGIEVATAEVIDQSISPAVEVVFPEQLKFPEFAFLNSPLTNEEKGHDVIIQFVNASREHLGSSDFDQIMGRSWDQSVWEDRLIKYMDRNGWMELDARSFLLFLVRRIGLENTLKTIKGNASYFKEITYLGFREKVFFYDNFLGEKVVNELLSKSLGGFVKKNSLSGLRDIISFIHKYIEDEEELRTFVKKGIINIARATYIDLIGVEAFLFEYNFTKAALKELIQESFTGLAIATSEKLQSVSEFLVNGKIRIKGQWQEVFDWEGENFTKAQVKELMQESFFGFANATPEKLQSVAEFLVNEYNFTKSEVKTLMQESLSGFANATSEKLQAVAEFLVNGKIRIKGQWQNVCDWEGENFTKAQVKELMQESFSGFANATPEKLQSVSEFLVNEYNFKKSEVKTLMQESFRGFAFAKPEKLQSVSEFLVNEYNFTKSEVKTLMQESFRGFAFAKPEKLQSVSEFLVNEYNFTKSEVKTLMQESFFGFALATPEKLQSVSEFLVNEYNFKKSEVKKLMQKSFQGFASATPEKLQVVAEFLVNEYNFKKSEVKTLMQESFQGFASATPEKLQFVAEFLVNGKIRIKGQWQEVFDWEGESFTKAQVKELKQESFFGFASATPEKLQAVAEFLVNEYNFKKSEVKTLMQKSFRGFANATSEKLQSVAEFLVNGKIRIKGQWQEVFDWEGESFTKAQVKELMQESFFGFANATPEKLQSVAEFLVNGKIRIKGQWREVFDWEGESFTKAQVKELMQESFFGFASATPEKLQSAAEFLVNEYNFTKSEVKTLMQESFRGFARATPEKLQVVAEFLVNEYNFKKSEVKTLMQKSFSGFSIADLRILKGVAESGINIYIEKEDIKKKMQHNIQVFLDINFNELTSLISSMEQMISLLPITQKQQWEMRLKQLLLDQLLEEDLIERLQSIKNEMTSQETSDLCQTAVLP